MLRLRAQIAERNFDVDLEITDFAVNATQHIVIMGPNGSGKSTIIELLAGTLVPDDGFIRVGHDVLVDLDAQGKGKFVPPHERSNGLLAQDPLLFPHLSVLDNVAFAPRSAGKSVNDAHLTAQRFLDLVDCAQFADRKPHELSGGQAQRVAIARTLAAHPKMILLDEPMAALDFDSVPDLLALFKRILKERLSVMVTHDLMDAATFADYIVIMDRGHIAEAGPIGEVLANPQSPFGLKLAGYAQLRQRIEQDNADS